MRSDYSILFYLKKNAVKKNGKVCIMGRISLNKQIAQFSTKQEVDINDWDTANGKVKGNKSETKVINKNLECIRTKLNGHYWDLYERGEDIDAESLRNLLFGLAQQQETLLSLFDDFNNQLSKSVGTTICKVTFGRYLRTRAILAKFIKTRYNLSDISIRKVNLQFIEDFECYLRTERRLGTNMVYKYMQYLKKIVRRAFNSGIIRQYPFENYNLKKEKVRVGFLSEEELLAIMNKPITIERLEKIRDVFVFSCFTGLAYVDVAKLTTNEISTFFDGKKWILTERQKNDNTVNVPLFKVPQFIIKKYEGTQMNNRLLPVVSNQKTNAYLKELADICGINKKLTFHMARHTFATTIMLSKGIPLETVGALLGHDDLKSTRIYAEVTGQKIINELPILNGTMDQYEKAFGA